MGKYLERINFINNKAPWLNDVNLNKLQDNVEDAIGKIEIKYTEMLKLIFPIGSTYITQTNVNPSTILGFGTWERLKAKVCLGLDEEDTDLNEIGKAGGEKKHTLTVNEMPSHTHRWHYAITSGHGSTEWISAGTNKTGTTGGVIEETGGSQAHNNMQPYEVVGYMWIRRT